MRRLHKIPPLCLFGVLLIGCESSSPQPGGSPTTRPANAPADGRNLSPELQRDFGHDPQWPNDIDRGGGGGIR